MRKYQGRLIRAVPVFPTGPTVTGVASGRWPLEQAVNLIKAGMWPSVGNGSTAYTTAGSYTFVAPAGVTSVSVVAIGGGSRGGGGLGYKNNYATTPGASYTVVVGTAANVTGSYFVSTATVQGAGANTTTGGGYVGDGGATGGAGVSGGGGGAAGYSGNGGAGGVAGGGGTAGGNGSGGGGGGGAGYTYSGDAGGGGGGVNVFGEGSSGAGGFGPSTVRAYGGYGGSAGVEGGYSTELTACCVPIGENGGNGGGYGGGAGIGSGTGGNGTGAAGAVRIVYPGTTRQFPSTRVGAVYG